jgi:competence protein ComEA
VAIASPQSPAATGQAPAPAAAGRPGERSPTPTVAASPASAAPKIKVHVLGAVRKPGVVALTPEARVQDALDAAGGARRSAELGDLNLAQPLSDGQQLFVSRDPDRTELRDPGAPVAGGTGSVGSGTTSAGAASAGSPPAKINVNTATPEELDQLPGIGPVTAQKIIAWREQHQRFSSVQELQEVDGIGPKTFADLEPLVTAP